MHYRVLGTLEVESEGRVLDLGRPKQRAVLAVLLLEANTVVSLDRLIDLLWGDEPPARATASLQAYVSNLRRTLEPDRPPNSPPRVLLTVPPGYLLRVGRDELDATRFEALAADGRRLLAEGRPFAARLVLDEALALWRGDALADFVYKGFTRGHVSRWEELRHVVTEDCLEAGLDLGDHVHAVAILEGLVARFPLRERLWGLLMVALYRGGRQGEALRAYTRARAALMDELGVEPGPALRRLESDILAHAPTLDWHQGGHGDVPPAVVDAPSSPPVPAPTPPFVGREAVLSRLATAVAEAAGGRGRVVLVSGEPGIGKTRLVEEVAARASAAGASVAWGGNAEGDGAPAFWPWAQVLRTVLGTAPSGTGQGDGGDGSGATGGSGGRPGAAWLARLVPEVAGALGSPGPPPALDGESARFRLSEAVLEALTAAAGEQPLVVVLDDLTWSDPASLALFEVVARRVASTRVLLVGTYRPADLSPDHPLVPTLAALARIPTVDRVALGGLTAADVSRFVAQGWAIEPGSRLVAALHDRTDGNPFYLTELVRLLASEGALGRADAVTRAKVPAGVRDVLRRRLARLPEATTTLLRVAAVVGRTFDLRLLSSATDHDEDRTLEAVEAALVTGVVVEDPSAVGRYQFAHALVHDALYEDLSAVRRARLHARVGAALEARPRDEAPLSELALHFARAAPAGGAEGYQKAVEYAMEAAAEAQARLAFEAVEAHLVRALELVGAMPEGPDRDRAELRAQNRLALSLMLNGGFVSPAAARACDRAAELALRLDDTAELLSSMAGLTKSATVRGEWQVVTGLGARMVALGEASGDPLAQAAGVFAIGNTEMFLGEMDASLRHVEEAIALARPHWALDAPPAVLWVNPLVFALGILALDRGFTDDEEGAAAAFREADELARAGGHPFWIVGVQLCAAIGHACAGRVADAHAEAERCIDLGQTTGLRVVVTVAEVVRSWAAARTDPAPERLAQLRDDLDACDGEGVRMWRPFRLMLLADACSRAERWQEAVSAADEGLARCDASGERVCEAELHRLRGLALAASGRAAEAEAALRRAVAVAEAQGSALFLRRAVHDLERLVASEPRRFSVAGGADSAPRATENRRRPST